jgi:elongation factor P
MLINATQIRAGMIIQYEGNLHRVMAMDHVTPGNWRAIIHVKMRNLKTGAQVEKRLSSDDKVEKAELDQHTMQYLYSDSHGHHFMNTETYDQIALSDEVMGESMPYLLPDQEVTFFFYEGNPVSVELPTTVVLEVVETQPQLKGATATASYKPAKTNTGLVVQVPQFIDVGQKIKVDTRDGKYLERA